MAREIVHATNLTKCFGSVKAIDKLSFTFSHGINGLLGPNGAGKTTLIALMLGLRKPTSGTIKVLGHSPVTQPSKIREQVGWVPEKDYFNISVPADDFLCHIGELAGLKRVSAAKRLSKLGSIMEMGEEIHRDLNTLSYGMKQKVKLIGALIHDPSLLILDDPIRGLDPTSQQKMLDLIQNIAQKIEKDIIIATHLEEVVEITNRVLVLKQGKKSIEKEVNKALKLRKTIKLRVRKETDENTSSFRDILQNHGLPAHYDPSSGSLSLTFSSQKDLSTVKEKILQLIVEHGFKLQAFITDSTGKEDNLYSLYEREASEY